MGLHGILTYLSFPLLRHRGEARQRQLAQDYLLNLHGLDDPWPHWLFHLRLNSVLERLGDDLLY